MTSEALVTVVCGRDEHGPFVHTSTPGGEVHARPGTTRKAGDLLHDLIHELLAIHAGMTESDVLKAVATGEPADSHLLALEEAAALAIQAYLNALTESNRISDGNPDPL